MRALSRTWTSAVSACFVPTAHAGVPVKCACGANSSRRHTASRARGCCAEACARWRGREERKRERERERRLDARDAHGVKKSKLTRDRERDISERIALGQVQTLKPYPPPPARTA